MKTYYLVHKGTGVNVADRKGVLHTHVLKDKMEFWPGFDKTKKGARQTLIGEVHLDPIGSIGTTHYNLTFIIKGSGLFSTEIMAQQLVQQGQVIFTTANADWPYMVVEADRVVIRHDTAYSMAVVKLPKGAGE